MLKKTLNAGFLLAALALSANLMAAGGRQDSLRGKEIIYGNWWGDYDVKNVVPGNESEEKQLEWRTRLQREHGFTMTAKNIGSFDAIPQLVTTAIIAGKPPAHLIYMYPSWAMALRKQGLLFPVSDSSAVDLTNTTAVPFQKIAFNQEIGRNMVFNGKQYGIAPDYGSTGEASGIYFNKRLFREAGLDPDLPYNMQRDGTWTWDNFLDICKRLVRDRNNTGRINTWAMPFAPTANLLRMFVFSNGGNFVDKDSTGRFVNASGRPEFLEAFQFMRRLLTEGLMMQRPDNASGEGFYISAFQDGTVAMTNGEDWQKSWWSSMTDDWGWVLPPRGPRASSYRFADFGNVVIIPSTYKLDEVDAILTALNLWDAPVESDWKVNEWPHFRDTRAVDETGTMIRSHRYGAFQTHALIPNFEIGDLAWQMWNFDGDPSRLIESVSAKWNSLISDIN